MTELLENENNFEALDQLIEDFTTEELDDLDDLDEFDLDLAGLNEDLDQFSPYEDEFAEIDTHH